MHTRSMIETHPRSTSAPSAALIAAIEAAVDCSQTCSACADSCLAEDTVAELRHCIRLTLDCADVCATMGRILTGRTATNEALLRQLMHVCVTACWVCGVECERHAGRHEHCRICFEACQDCERACRAALSAM